jgi:NAD(P)-dependent dehydrogenase (short-subunit alcohol dehydrogenase family)
MSEPLTSLVTGANAGIGYATAAGLARAGHRVVLLCRNPQKAEEARRRMATATGNADLHVLICDLADLDAVAAAADEFLQRFDRLDVLVHNAGVITKERELSPQGHELLLAVDVLGPYLLTWRLQHRLAAAGPGRLVHLAGIYGRKGVFDLDDPSFERRPWTMADANAAAQLARVALAVAWAEHLRGAVVCNAVHPGAVRTHAQDSAPPWAVLLIDTVLKPAFVAPAVGAKPVLRLALGEETRSGQWFRRQQAVELPEAARNPIRRQAIEARVRQLVGLDAGEAQQPQQR